jgi:hypothetical protein
MLSNSSWDRSAKRISRSPAFSMKESAVVFEFPNRSRRKIFENSLGRVEFLSEPGRLNNSRDEVIQKSYGERTLSGYRYPSVSHAHILPTLLSPELEILAHGTPVKGGWENCAMAGMSCSEGDDDTRCGVGKCLIGYLERDPEFSDRWIFNSYVTPGLYYYVYGVEYVNLKTVIRGKFILPAGLDTINVQRKSSILTTVYLPPNTYEKETFTRRVIKSLDPESLQDSLNVFLRAVMGSEILATIPAEKRTYEKVVNTVIKSLPGVWSEFVIKEIDSVWINKFLYNNREFLIKCYEILGDLYSRGVQVSKSSFNRSSVSVDTDISRPVYNRLPGITGSYNSDNPDSDVAAWLVSGSDMELSRSKTLIDRFYSVFLDPETCYPPNLDWIAQHMGFFGGMWNLEWSTDVKRLLLANAHKNSLSPGGIWTDDPDLDTLRQLDLSATEEVEESVIEEVNKIVTVSRYKEKVFNEEFLIVETVTVPDLLIDMSSWPGLIPSRGSLVTTMFLFWAFGIKAISAEEMTISEDGSYRVRDGLRRVELDSPVNLPVIYDVLHVGTEQDSEVGVYGNQLVAGMGVCRDTNLSNTVVIRMPFYYNRDGRTWNSARSIVENWMPGTVEKRLQYGYAAADLLVAEDILYTV